MTKQDIISNLAIKHYPFKWKKALAFAKSGFIPQHMKGFNFWQRAYTYYLELGGAYIKQMPLITQITHYSNCPKNTVQ